METGLLVTAFILFFIVAALYSSIGHAGASGYLAIMALLSFAPESIKPTSLILNIAVAAIASWRFISAGYFDRKIFFAFILFSLPAAFVGGYLKLSPALFKTLAGSFLILSAIFLVIRKKERTEEIVAPKQLFLYSSVLGTAIGFFSGIIGVGGGIFLTPLLLMFRWTPVKNASGISALFILCNSVSGLLGHLAGLNKVEEHIGFWLLAVIAGGFIGAYFGTKKFNTKAILWCLFIVLMTAGLKFILVDAMK